VEKYPGIVQIKPAGGPDKDGKQVVQVLMALELTERDAQSVLESGSQHPAKVVVDNGIKGLNIRVDLETTVE
jgi:hypothetical protein